MKRCVLFLCAVEILVIAFALHSIRADQPLESDEILADDVDPDPIDMDGDGVPLGERDPAEYANGIALYWAAALPSLPWKTDPLTGPYTMCGSDNDGDSVEIPGAALFNSKGDVVGYSFGVGGLPVDLQMVRIVLGSDCL